MTEVDARSAPAPDENSPGESRPEGDPPSVKRLVIVGASLAGMKAVEGARKSGYAGEIVLIGDEHHFPYDRPPLSKRFLDDERDVPYFREHTSYVEDLDATLLLGSPAIALRPAEKAVIVDGRAVHYDALVIATGASPRTMPQWAGMQGVVTLRRFADAVTIRGALDAQKNVTIIGAGFIGAEIASAARKSGCTVTIVEATETPLARAVGPEMGILLSKMHEKYGTALYCGVTVASVNGGESGDKVQSVELSDGRVIPTDLLLVSIGASPATEWLRDSGIELTPDGGIVCDASLQTSLPGVYAAGDVVHWPNAIMDTTMRLEHWTSANEQGALAGKNAAGVADRAVYETVPYFWSDWYGNRIQFVGVAGTITPHVVSGSVESDKFVALYQLGDRVVGALTVNEPSRIMKERRRISQRTSWQDALDVYAAADAARAGAVAADAIVAG
ncbi:MAG: pyridine nucleotide-disulfide oxidoreductase [Subtercola sp.]|nr:pyridine nucleotide-disulfide oxidoreductase [Subtercola sp.]